MAPICSTRLDRSGCSLCLKDALPLSAPGEDCSKGIADGLGQLIMLRGLNLVFSSWACTEACLSSKSAGRK